MVSTQATPAGPASQDPADAEDRPSDCKICALERADTERVVFSDDDWSCEVMAGLEVPGWLVLRARRHALGLSGLTHQELLGLGPRLGEAVTALEKATGAPAVYTLSFGENSPHFHALLIARMDDIEPEQRMGAILGLHPERVDVAAALELAATVRSAWSAIG
jgi:diadenosine tetraphosphate (Ap4A) HIT family hydrolase